MQEEKNIQKKGVIVQTPSVRKGKFEKKQNSGNK